jgi:hypothetical protein
MCGTDWRNYELYYTQEHIYVQEIGYWIYMQLFHILGISFWPFFIVTKILTLLIFIYTIEKYSSPKTIFFVWTFFLAFAGFYLWIDNPMRNLIAMSIFLLAIPSLEKRHWIRFSLWAILACSFHASAIVMFLFYFVANIHFKYFHIILLYLLINIIFINRDVIYAIGELISIVIPKLSDKISFYRLAYDEPVSLFSLGFILHNGLFMLMLLVKNKFYELPNGQILFNFSFLFILFYRIVLTFSVMNRLVYMECMFYIIGIFGCLYLYSKLYRQLLITGVLLISLFIAYKNLTQDCRYIPYTNYLSYIFRQKPSYEDRDLYNEKHSPYNNWREKKEK